MPKSGRCNCSRCHASYRVTFEWDDKATKEDSRFVCCACKGDVHLRINGRYPRLVGVERLRGESPPPAPAVSDKDGAAHERLAEEVAAKVAERLDARLVEGVAAKVAERLAATGPPPPPPPTDREQLLEGLLKRLPDLLDVVDQVHDGYVSTHGLSEEQLQDRLVVLDVLTTIRDRIGFWLESVGFERIPAENARRPAFDRALHVSAGTWELPDVANGPVVLDVYQSGYRWQGELLRKARVVRGVAAPSAGPPPSSAPSDAPPEDFVDADRPA